MIIASIKEHISPSESLKFRGFSLEFWIPKIFNQIKYCNLSDIPGDCKFICVFQSDLFLDIPEDGFVEVLRFLKNQDPRKDKIFTIDGEPFYVFSRKFIEASDNPPDMLNNDQPAEIIPLDTPYSVYNLKNKMLIEACIVSFQIDFLSRNGVVIEDYRNFYMEGVIPIGSGSSIATGVVLKGDSSIGKQVQIFPHVYLENSIVGDHCVVLPGCIVRGSQLEDEVRIGPYSHLREGALVKKGAKMGNFVEMKKSVLGEGSKSMHLTYIGDADIGKNVNIGAGTITCNYDGINKNKTIIEDDVFVGSGTELVAPVSVGKGSYIGAGSTITVNVPPDSLGVSREKQRNLLNWAKKKRKK